MNKSNLSKTNFKKTYLVKVGFVHKLMKNIPKQKKFKRQSNCLNVCGMILCSTEYLDKQCKVSNILQSFKK